MHKKYNVLVIGSGGREHAICQMISTSPLLNSLHAIPGNPGIAQLALTKVIDLIDHHSIYHYCLDNAINFVIVGPELPLANGIVDYLTSRNIPTFGPSQSASQLESSKIFTKQLCSQHNIPTAAYGVFDNISSAKNFVNNDQPVVIKADGLAAGKGVIIAKNQQEAYDAIDEIFAGKFGTAGQRIIIEEFLEGPEVSFFALCSHDHAIYFNSAQDYKRIGDDDTGPNTGGMGSIAPSPLMSQELSKNIMQQIIYPTLHAMKKAGSPFTGILFAGLILTKDGPKLLEYNVRFGDPETESMLPLLGSDLLEIMLATSDNKLDQVNLKWKKQVAVSVVMANRGYPGEYQSGSLIKHSAPLANSYIFHAGTKTTEGQLTAAGGRVLVVTALGEDFTHARKLAYQMVASIEWAEGYYRTDIGKMG